MKERNSGKSVALSAARADMCVNTARKYMRSGSLPSHCKARHTWRTRLDPFVAVSDEVSSLLRLEPSLEAKTIFEHLQRSYPGVFQDGQLRTLQRWVKLWRVTNGPGKEVFFAQEHTPGDLCASDFCHMTRLRVTIAGAMFEHLVYHFVLTYSNWESVSICLSESLESLSAGLQNALWALGGVPRRHRTDSLTAAVTQLKDRQEFTARYEAVMTHYGLSGEHTQPSHPNENGDVEQSHRRFVERIDQALMLRGSRDFAARTDYEAFLAEHVRRANLGRQARFEEECRKLAQLPAMRLSECRSLESVRVSPFGTIRVLGNTYSVSDRLVGERVSVRVHADTLDVFYAQRSIETLERVRGKGKHRIDYRHFIDALVRKPGAFASYVYREQMFPTSQFRAAYAALAAAAPAQADKLYLKIVKLAKDEGQERVEIALRSIARAGVVPGPDTVKQALAGDAEAGAGLTQVHVDAVDLCGYDALLLGFGAPASRREVSHV